MKHTRFLAATFLSLGVADVRAQMVGDTVCVEGFIMDEFCIDNETLLDNSAVRTLEGPEQHSVHCLVDVTVCTDSDFTILAEPVAEGELYTVAYKVDNAGKEILIQLARDAGDPSHFCRTCTGGGSLKMGFRAEVTGIIIDERTPPTLQVIAALPSNGREEQACLAPTESPSMTPTDAPETEDLTASPVVADEIPEPMDPTASPVAAEEETNAPSAPTTAPIESPTDMPNVSSTDSPSVAPSGAPNTDSPSTEPSAAPLGRPSAYPSLLPSDTPSAVPSDAPSNVPSSVPSATPQQTGPTVDLRVVPDPVPLQADATLPASGAPASARRQGAERAIYALSVLLLAIFGVVLV